VAGQRASDVICRAGIPLRLLIAPQLVVLLNLLCVEDLNRVEVIFEKIREMLRKHPGIDQDQLTLVNVVDGATDMGSAVGGFYGSSSINFMVYTFTKTTNWARFQKVQDDVMLAIGRIIRAEGGDIAFTSYSLFVESVPEALIKAIPTSNPQPSSPPEDSNPGSEK